MSRETTDQKPVDLPALAALAGLAAATAPRDEVPIPSFTPDQINLMNLNQALIAADRMLKERAGRITELAADRDKWKTRAEKAEAAGDGLALERVTKERDGLRVEVSKLTKRITEYGKESSEEIAQLKATLKTSMADANEAASQAERLRTTMEQAIRARDRAFAERDAAREERVEAMKRGIELSDELKKAKERIAEKDRQGAKPAAVTGK